MADIRNNPHFVLFPLNNARTGYKPYAMPALYVEPRRFDPNGNGVENSEAIRVRFRVVDAPDPAKVNGPFNTNIRIPDESLFEIELSSVDLARRVLDLRGLQFFDPDGNPKNFIDAVEGDTFRYALEGTSQTSGSNPIDDVVYYPDAIYYDVSDVEIDVEQLPRPRRYLFVWESVYFIRFPTATGDLKCIGDEIGLSDRKLEVNHPGEVHEFMYKTTPGFYFDSQDFSLATDSTIEFYRPLADVLQDIFDEQELLDGVNHVNTVPAEFIPYLSFLIGWDLPNFPGTTDSLRRTILRRGSELQKLKSSRRVINELFETFGFTIDIINLWASVDGNSLLAPGNGLEVKDLTHTDTILSDFDAQSFGVGDVPLLFRPQRDTQLVLYSWLATPGTAKYDELVTLSEELANDLEARDQEGTVINENGVLQPSFVNEIGKKTGNGVVGYSEVVVGSGSSSLGRPILNHRNIKFNNDKNLISLFFDHEMSVESGQKIFVFGVYKRNKIIVPDELSNTRTNKFDIQILDREGFPVNFTLLLSLLDFLFRLKSFHSLLRKIQASVLVTDVYNVTDFCVDGNDILAPGTPLGELQVPPAIIPEELAECENDNDRGFKKEDELLKTSVIQGLEEEFQAWKLLEENCGATPDGQDKVYSDDFDVTSSEQRDFDHVVDDRPTLCEDDPTNPDFCYKGRVKDLIENILVIAPPQLTEYVKCKPCDITMGNVVYWEKDSVVDLDGQTSGGLGISLRHRIDDRTLHYSDTPYIDENTFNDQNTIAINPININIQKDNLNFPSHRMMSMGKMADDFNYTQSAAALGIDFDTARRRPWDDGGVCGIFDILDAELVEDSIGNELLIWEVDDLVYLGNGLESDIPSLDDHGDPTSDGRVITHALYQFAEPSHESLIFEQTVFENDPTNELIDADSSVTGIIFGSACSDTSEDFIGGYPARYNWMDADEETFDDGVIIVDGEVTSPVISRDEISDGLGIIKSGGTNRGVARYFFGSQEYVRTDESDYKFYFPYRIDCSCLDDFCEVTESEVSNCNSSALFNSEGELDVDCDKIDNDLTITLAETMSMCTRLSDGELQNLFCINDECTIPEVGNFEYKDTYGIIYEVEWVLALDTLDITVTRKDPRVPGREPNGFTQASNEGVRVFREGVITVARKIIKYSDGFSFVDAEGSEETIGFFQTNKVCSDQFDDPFSYGIDCSLQDQIEMLYTDGPHWMDGIGDATGFAFSAASLGISKRPFFWGDPLDSNDQSDLIWSPGNKDIEPLSDSSLSSQSTASTSSESTDSSFTSSLSSQSTEILSSNSSSSDSSTSSSTTSSTSSDSTPSTSSSTDSSLSSSSDSSDSTSSDSTSSDSSDSTSSDSSTSTSSDSSESTESTSSTSDSTQSTDTTSSSSDSSDSDSSESTDSNSSLSSSSSSLAEVFYADGFGDDINGAYDSSGSNFNGKPTFEGPFVGIQQAILWFNGALWVVSFDMSPTILYSAPQILSTWSVETGSAPAGSFSDEPYSSSSPQSSSTPLDTSSSSSSSSS